MPGPYGVGLDGRPWKIVITKGAARTSASDLTGALNPTNWRATLASGTTTMDGECVLNQCEREAIWHAAHAHPGNVWLVSGPNATLVSVVQMAASPGEREHRKTLDALNYITSADSLDEVQKKVQVAWTENEYKTPIHGRQKSDTDL